MLAVLLVLGAALASGPGPQPEKPKPPKPVPSECDAAVGVVAGSPIGWPLVQNGVAACSFTAIPTSDLADLMALESWGQAVYDHGRIMDSYWNYKLAEVQYERDFYKSHYEALVAKPNWWEKPATQRTVGAVGAIAVFATTAYVMGQLYR